MILVVSGRASFELTQKAVLAGHPGAGRRVGAELTGGRTGREAGLTLVGFVRGETMNIYTHPERDHTWPTNGQIRLLKNDHAAPVSAAA